jgi:uncharacterized C2H2 Zn-finger protein
MMQDIMEYRVTCYVGKDGRTVLRCPKCDTTKTIDTSNGHYAFRKFKATCQCGTLIKGQFEFRKHFRKKVRLSGAYKKRDTGVRGKIIVQDISLLGVGFSCLRKHHFQKGDQLDISFVLDNTKRSEVKLWVEVINIDDRFVGAKRCDPQLMQPELGFYLKS